MTKLINSLLFHQIAQPTTNLATPMTKQTAEPLHLSKCIDVYTDFSRDCFRVRFNADQLENGNVSAYVEDILNRASGRYVRDPYTEEMREAVRDALTTYFEDAAFASYFIGKVNIYF